MLLRVVQDEAWRAGAAVAVNRAVLPFQADCGGPRRPCGTCAGRERRRTDCTGRIPWIRAVKDLVSLLKWVTTPESSAAVAEAGVGSVGTVEVTDNLMLLRCLNHVPANPAPKSCSLFAA